MFKKAFLLPIFVCFSFLAHAGTELPAQTIRLLGTGWDSEGIYISTDEGIQSQSCGSGGLILQDHILKDEIISILLSAYHANSKVKFYVDGCTGSNMKIQAVKMVK